MMTSDLNKKDLQRHNYKLFYDSCVEQHKFCKWNNLSIYNPFYIRAALSFFDEPEKFLDICRIIQRPYSNCVQKSGLIINLVELGFEINDFRALKSEYLSLFTMGVLAGMSLRHLVEKGTFPEDVVREKRSGLFKQLYHARHCVPELFKSYLRQNTNDSDPDISELVKTLDVATSRLLFECELSVETHMLDHYIDILNQNGTLAELDNIQCAQLLKNIVRQFGYEGSNEFYTPYTNASGFADINTYLNEKFSDCEWWTELQKTMTLLDLNVRSLKNKSFAVGALAKEDCFDSDAQMPGF